MVFCQNGGHLETEVKLKLILTAQNRCKSKGKLCETIKYIYISHGELDFIVPI